MPLDAKPEQLNTKSEPFNAKDEVTKLEDLAKKYIDGSDKESGEASSKMRQEWASLDNTQRLSVAMELKNQYDNRDINTLPRVAVELDKDGNVHSLNFIEAFFDVHNKVYNIRLTAENDSIESSSNSIGATKETDFLRSSNVEQIKDFNPALAADEFTYLAKHGLSEKDELKRQALDRQLEEKWFSMDLSQRRQVAAELDKNGNSVDVQFDSNGNEKSIQFKFSTKGYLSSSTEAIQIEDNQVTVDDGKSGKEIYHYNMHRTPKTTDPPTDAKLPIDTKPAMPSVAPVNDVVGVVDNELLQSRLATAEDRSKKVETLNEEP